MSMALDIFSDGAIGKTCVSVVVYMELGRWLGVSKLGEGGANGNEIVARVSYLIHGHDLLTCYIIGPM